MSVSYTPPSNGRLTARGRISSPHSTSWDRTHHGVVQFEGVVARSSLSWNTRRRRRGGALAGLSMYLNRYDEAWVVTISGRGPVLLMPLSVNIPRNTVAAAAESAEDWEAGPVA